jgi:hypothetical protein
LVRETPARNRIFPRLLPLKKQPKKKKMMICLFLQTLMMIKMTIRVHNLNRKRKKMMT